jgi:hypothetical protein
MRWITVSTYMTNAISSRPTRSARRGRSTSIRRRAVTVRSISIWLSKSTPGCCSPSNGEDPPDEFSFPLTFTWALPPLPQGPDLLRLAIDLAGIGGIELPLESSAIDSYASATDPAERRITIVARQQVSLARVLAGEELLCDTFDKALAVSQYLLERAPNWLEQS